MTKEEAIERIKIRFDKWALDDGDMRAIQTLIPELKESEDERIRKEIITLLQEIAEDDDYCGRNHCDEYIAYLEKQKEQILSPLFKVGDRIKLKSEPKYPFREIIAIKDGAYYFDTAVHLPFKEQDKWEAEQRPTNSEKPKEWSEEEQQIIEDAACALISFSNTVETKKEEEELCELASKLQDLRPQPHWKPSEEQMNVLDKVYHYLWADRNATADMQDGLGDFIDELKKL